MGTKTVRFDDLDQTEHSDAAPVTTHSIELDGTTRNSGRTWLTAKPPTVHMAKNKIRMIQRAIR